MDPTAMDDKLYYVEGPQSQVLGPMNMIHILEGIAAGAILEDARICGVGEQEWTNLADVAYTRDVQAEASEPTPSMDETPHDAIDDTLEFTTAMDSITSAEEEADEVSGERTEEVIDELALESMEQEAIASLDDAGFVHAESANVEPVDAIPTEMAGFEEEMSVAAIPTELPASALPYETSTAGASDFALDMQEGSPESESAYTHDETESEVEAADEWDSAEAASTGSSGRPAWAIPVAVAVGVPVVFGIYMLASGKLPIGSQDAPTQVATQQVTPDPTLASKPVALAWEKLDAGETAEALVAFREIIDARPESPRAHHGLGLAYMEEGDTAAAIQHLTQARDFAPQNADVRLDLSRVLASDGRLEGAVKEVAAYLDAHPENVDVQSERLDWMMQAGQHAAASSAYADYAAANPSVARAQYLAGLAHPDSEDGVAFLRHAAALAPGDPLIGKALDRAVVSIRGTQKVASTPTPTPAKPVSDRATVAVVVPPTPKPTKVTPPPTRSPLAEYVSNIRDGLASEHFTDVRNHIDAGRTEMAGDKNALANLGLWSAICDFHEGEFDDALAAFEKLSPKASYETSGFGAGALENWIARVHFSSGNARFAVGVLDQVGLDSADEYASARLWEGVALASLGMDELAERTWARVQPDVGARVTSTGLPAVKTAEFLTGAISEKQYRTALASDDLWANDMEYFLGYSARRADNPELAREHFQKALNESQGKEFPYHLAEAEIAGEGLTGAW